MRKLHIQYHCSACNCWIADWLAICMVTPWTSWGLQPSGTWSLPAPRWHSKQRWHFQLVFQKNDVIATVLNSCYMHCNTKFSHWTRQFGWNIFAYPLRPEGGPATEEWVRPDGLHRCIYIYIHVMAEWWHLGFMKSKATQMYTCCSVPVLSVVLEIVIHPIK